MTTVSGNFLRQRGSRWLPILLAWRSVDPCGTLGLSYRYPYSKGKPEGTTPFWAFPSKRAQPLKKTKKTKSKNNNMQLRASEIYVHSVRPVAQTTRRARCCSCLLPEGGDWNQGVLGGFGKVFPNLPRINRRNLLLSKRHRFGVSG